MVQVEAPVWALASAPAQDLAVDMEAAPQVEKTWCKHLAVKRGTVDFALDIIVCWHVL